MLRIVVALVVVVLAVAFFSFKRSEKQETVAAPVSKIDVITAYHETGSEAADRNLRYVAGFCADELAGGNKPEFFKDTIADVFISTLTNQKDKPLEPGALVQLYVERRREQVENYAQRIETPGELIMVTQFFRAWQRKPERFVNCVYEQLDGRGYLQRSER